MSREDRQDDDDRGPPDQLSVARRLVHIGGWTALFSGCTAAGEWALRKYSERYRQLDLPEQRRTFLLVPSGVNALLSTGYAVYHISRLWQGRMTDEGCAAGTRGSLELLIGYFIYDTWAMRHDLRGNLSDMAHHGLVLVLLPGLLFGTNHRSIHSCMPNFMVVEASTIFMDIAKMYRALGMQTALGSRLAARVFLASFFLLRVVGLPLYTYSKYVDGTARKGAPYSWFLYAACLMQWYWFGLIVRKLAFSPN